MKDEKGFDGFRKKPQFFWKCGWCHGPNKTIIRGHYSSWHKHQEVQRDDEGTKKKKKNRKQRFGFKDFLIF